MRVACTGVEPTVGGYPADPFGTWVMEGKYE